MRKLDEEAGPNARKQTALSSTDFAATSSLARKPAFCGDREKLMKAIDDYLDEMTGDRTTLHAKNHSCG
jgi:hypothetical protein